MRYTILLLLTWAAIHGLIAQAAENIFIITFDGLRWQEVYGGAIDSMMQNPELTRDKEVILRFGAGTREEARRRLMPWFWSTLAEKGQLYGNRWSGNKMNCANPYWFSYPGYNEILTGYSDPAVNSNDKNYNENKTILEWLHEKPEFRGRVAAFGSWDVFPYIINDTRSGIPINAGFRKAEDRYLTYTEQLLNDLQDEIPSPWGSVRLDAFTHHYMMEYVKKHHPRVVYIAYGETDDFAHDGRYDQYLKSAYQTDHRIAQIWDFIQQDPLYKDNTAVIITTDHGRGESPMTKWKSHGKNIGGSGAIWMAAIGPNVPARGMIEDDQQLYQNQIAATIAALLGLEYKGPHGKAGAPVRSVVRE